MSIENYYTDDIIIYESTNVGTVIKPDLTWDIKNTFKGNCQVVSGNQAVINTGSKIIADIILMCSVPNLPNLEDRILFESDIYKVVFPENPHRKGHHAEILLKRMPANTATEMGI